MPQVILYGSADVTPSELVLLLHEVVARSPDTAPADVSRLGSVIELTYEGADEQRPPVVSLYLTVAGERTVATMESSSSPDADVRAIDLVRRVLRLARGEEHP